MIQAAMMGVGATQSAEYNVVADWRVMVCALKQLPPPLFMGRLIRLDPGKSTSFHPYPLSLETGLSPRSRSHDPDDQDVVDEIRHGIRSILCQCWAGQWEIFDDGQGRGGSVDGL